MICKPSGNPSDEPEGTDIAGTPAIFAGAMLAFTIYFSRGKSKSMRITESASHV